jgi:hypothetical protein
MVGFDVERVGLGVPLTSHVVEVHVSILLCTT